MGTVNYFHGSSEALMHNKATLIWKEEREVFIDRNINDKYLRQFQKNRNWK